MALVYTLVASFLVGTISTLHIDITPNKYELTEDNTGSVNISCHLDMVDATARNILLIQIARNGEDPVVLIQKGSGISYGISVTNQSKFQVEGTFHQDKSKSYLKLTLLEPEQSDSGVYVCKMFYTDQAGRLTEHRAIGNLTVERFDLKEVVRNLLDKVAFLETKLKAQADKESDIMEELATLKNATYNQPSSNNGKDPIVLDRISTLEDKTRNLTHQMAGLPDQDSLASILGRMATLENQSQAQSQRINDWTDKAKYSSAFSATLSGSIKLTSDDSIVFDTVVMKQGQGYDEKTGVFTVPLDGLYAFSVVMMINNCNSCSGSVAIRANNFAFAGLYVSNYEFDKREQSSVSSVRMLQKGDKVKVQLTGSAGTNEMQWFGQVGDYYSMFTGFLVKAQ